MMCSEKAMCFRTTNERTSEKMSRCGDHSQSSRKITRVGCIMLSKLNTVCLSRHVQWTHCLIRLSTSYAANRPSQVKFDSESDAYAYKSKGELFRGWFVFKLCSYTPLVNRLNQVERPFLSEKMNLVCFSHSFRFSMVYAV